MPPSRPDDPFDDVGGDPEHVGSRPDGERGWRHPSEVAMQARQQQDRARPRRIAAVAALALGGALIAVGVALGWGWVPSSDEQAAGGGGDPSAVVSLTLVSAGGTSARTGVLIGSDDQIVTRAEGVDTGTQVWVAVTGREPLLARLVGADPDHGVVLLRVDSPVGRTVELADEPDVGDRLVVYSASVAEQRAQRWSTSVAAADVDEVQADGTRRRGMFLADGGSGAVTASSVAVAGITGEQTSATTGTDGVVYDEDGRLVGVVVSERTGSGDLVFTSAEDLAVVVDRLSSVSAQQSTPDPGGPPIEPSPPTTGTFVGTGGG